MKFRKKRKENKEISISLFDGSNLPSMEESKSIEKTFLDSIKTKPDRPNRL